MSNSDSCIRFCAQWQTHTYRRVHVFYMHGSMLAHQELWSAECCEFDGHKGSSATATTCGSLEAGDKVLHVLVTVLLAQVQVCAGTGPVHHTSLHSGSRELGRQVYNRWMYVRTYTQMG